MRLDKFLSDSTKYSRKEIRRLVRYRAILVDGVVASSPEMQVGEDALITLNGKKIDYCKYLYVMLNKPAGYLSATEDARGDKVVTELVPEEWKHFELFPAGRLDKDTEGLLILTNDGAFSHALSAPARKIPKCYYAELDAPMEEKDRETFASGMDLGDFTAKPGLLEWKEDPAKVFITITEGKFHQVKRMCEKVGKKVLFLKRLSIGSLSLDPALPSGKMRLLTEAEKALLLQETP